MVVLLLLFFILLVSVTAIAFFAVLVVFFLTTLARTTTTAFVHVHKRSFANDPSLMGVVLTESLVLPLHEMQRWRRTEPASVLLMLMLLMLLLQRHRLAKAARLARPLRQTNPLLGQIQLMHRLLVCSQVMQLCVRLGTVGLATFERLELELLVRDLDVVGQALAL